MTPASASSQRLLVVAEADPWSPSTRYRALQHLPRLRDRFAEVSLALPGDPVGREDGRRAQARYFATHGVRYLEQGARVRRRLAGADALLVQRGLYVVGPGAILAALRGFDGRVVYDLDDALFTPDPALALKGPAARWLYGGQQSRGLLRRADAVLVSTDRLAAMLPETAAPVTVLPTVPDVGAHVQVIHTDHAPIVVGWAGTVGGIGFLDPLREVLGRLHHERLVTLEVVSSAPWDGPARFHPWRLAEETSVFSRFAVGIMPLPRGEFTRAKAGFKLLQYMASGLPVVGSPVGVNVELIERSGAGFLAETPAEWEAALRRLAGDPALRAELGRRGHAFVESYADLDVQARTLTALLSGP